MKYCPKCNSEIEESKFCPGCGHKIKRVDSKKTKKYLLLTASTIVIAFLIFGIVYKVPVEVKQVFKENVTKYRTEKITEYKFEKVNTRNYETVHRETQELIDSSKMVAYFKMKYDSPLRVKIDSDLTTVGFLLDSLSVDCYGWPKPGSFDLRDQYYSYFHKTDVEFNTRVDRGIRELCLVIIPQRILSEGPGTLQLEVEQEIIEDRQIPTTIEESVPYTEEIEKSKEVIKYQSWFRSLFK